VTGVLERERRRKKSVRVDGGKMELQIKAWMNLCGHVVCSARVFWMQGDC
jgi:hypothetical protein